MITSILKVCIFGAAITTLFTTTSCGPPPAAGGPPSEFSVQAIIAAVEPTQLEESIRVVGSLRALREVEVVSELSAVVEELLFSEGAPVEAGEELVRLRDDRIRARFRETQARFDLAAANFLRGQDLLKANTISQSDFDRLIAEYNVAAAVRDSAEADLADAVIRAPFDGIISERIISEGAFVRVGEPITRLVQIDPLEATFSVPERFTGRIAPNQEIRLRTTARPDEEYRGRVAFIDPVVDQRSRTVLMRARVENAEGHLKPGMFITLELVIEVDDHALLIPEAALQLRRDQAFVFVQNEDGVAERRNVRTGLRQRERVQITEGLQAGDRVVVEGHQKMGPGTRIDVSPDSIRYGIEVEDAVPDTADS